MPALEKYVTVLLEPVQCYKCNCWFGIDSEQQRRLLERGGDFWCPNGHAQQYTTTENRRLKDELAREKHRAEQARADAENARRQRDQNGRRLNATRGVVTRIKNRVSKGVCPCCNRTFQDLARHMAGKHPTYAAGGE